MCKAFMKYHGNQQKTGRAVSLAEVAHCLAGNSDSPTTFRRKAAGPLAPNAALPKNGNRRIGGDRKGGGSATDPEVGPEVARSERGAASATFPGAPQILEYLRNRKAAAASPL